MATKFCISRLILNVRMRWVAALALVLVVLILFVLIVCDYSRVKAVRKLAGNVQQGAKENDVVDVIGHPDSVSSGAFVDKNGNLTKGYTVWTYCSRFDWVGFRTRSDEASTLYYWYSRLNPQKNCTHDAIVEMWFMNGRLENVVDSNRSDSFGQHSRFSL